MPGEPSDIPVGSQFTPALQDLREILQAFLKHSGDLPALQDKVWHPPVYLKTPPEKLTKRRRNLPLEAAVQYELLSSGSYEATDICRQLAELENDALYDAFARHILLNLGGLRVVEGIEQMHADGLKVTADSLAQYLTDQGFRVTVHNTAINSLRMWLAMAGLFPKQKSQAWKVNQAAKERLVGLNDEAVSVLAALDQDQRAFAQALCELDPQGEILASDVRSHAEFRTGLRLERSSLPKRYLEPLAAAGLITFASGGTAGGKSARLQTTEAFKKDVLEPFIERTTATLDSAVATYYRQRPSDIYAGLESQSTFEKGQALEAFAVLFMKLLGLRFEAWRKRGQESRGFEVDAVLGGVLGGTPTRWQIQCKNTPAGRVDLEDIAKEVGIHLVTRSTHILFVANCRFTEDARRFAMQVMLQHPLVIFLLDDAAFREVRDNPSRLAPLLHEQAIDIDRARHGRAAKGSSAEVPASSAIA